MALGELEIVQLKQLSHGAQKSVLHAYCGKFVKYKKEQRTWLAQSVQQATLDLRVTSLSPTLGAETT